MHMSTIIVHHNECLLHRPGYNHPERPDRVRAVLSALDDISGTEFLPAPLAQLEQITRVHPESYWQDIVNREPDEGELALDEDTYLSPGSVNAALRASGAVCFAIDQVMAGKADNAFCAVRPPGHHAESSRAMGFCLLNHIAIGARQAIHVHGLDSVAIVDIDLHHGNGTQAIFEQDPKVLYISSHQMPLYPGTGNADETGVGNILNIPLPPGAGGAAFRTAYRDQVFPALHQFRPELLLISAGLDAHRLDPLGDLQLEADDYAWVTRELLDIAQQYCDGKVISLLEGGYDLQGLGEAAKAHVQALTQS